MHLSRQPSQYNTLQPRFEPPANARQAPTRDRFRGRAKSGIAYDDVEDDGDGAHDVGYGYDDRMELDEFDERLLQQSYSDRRSQAELGHARLSFAPGTRYPTSATEWDHEAPRDEIPLRSQLSRFIYHDEGKPDSSPEVQFCHSSSPALKAGQRRADDFTTALRLHRFKNERHSTASQPLFDTEHTPEPYIDRSTQLMNDGAEAEQQRTTQHYDADHRQGNLQPRNSRPSNAPPVCQGIQLVPVSNLPDRLRTIFPYPIFNAVQSKCFDRVFRSDDNFVLASPTGSGKTVILELAICRAIATNATGQYKVVYQAPTKALCSERQRDWDAKFKPLGLKCAELTGDSDAADLRNVQGANIIITTPEKWDSITRKWKDHEKLMRLVRVFLIDEVHILREDRGAVLEAVVSRMKSLGTEVRFVALSATVPNFNDVAIWLGKNSSQTYVPAAHEKFGEEFRPVKLRKHVCGYNSQCNDFGLDKVIDAKLPEIISKYSESKPIMIFCATRASCVNTAKLLALWWKSDAQHGRFWKTPPNPIAMLNRDLRETSAYGVAFHHGGLDYDDRASVEQAYLRREISVICCTSTLAVGVNLPCHLVIIKNTVLWTDEGFQEYSDLEMMQMLGRAGRPQHDDSAVAVILTRQSKVQRYEKMVTGQELLESKLHLNLIAHMNAEIGLGTIRNSRSARSWLIGTFLYVRLQQNPSYYKLQGARSGQDIEEQIDDICSRDIGLLRDYDLISGDDQLRCTEFGHAMARYYVQFDTMKVFMGLKKKASPSEILSALAQASEFSKVRFRAGEKSMYKSLNKSPSIRFPIPVNIDLPAHKVSLLIQSVLGSAEMSWEGEAAKHKNQYVMESQLVFKNISSLIRCVIDCQIYLGDSVSIHNSLLIERSLGSRAWDDSPLQLRQVESIGAVAVRKLVNAGIRNMEELEGCDAHRIETLIGRNPPFGMRVLEVARTFPKLRVSLHAQPASVTKTQNGIKIQVKADIGFINERPPHRFGNKLVYVCILVDTSDGRKVHFARISGQKLGKGQTLVFPAILTAPDQSINCYVMCDSIAGSMREATVKPEIPASMFPAHQQPQSEVQQQPNTSRRRMESLNPVRKPSVTSEDFSDDGIDDDALVNASFSDLDFEHIDDLANPLDSVTRKNTAKNQKSGVKANRRALDIASTENSQDHIQLPNGKWTCAHKCKDKTACKHLCCKEGMDKPPKKSAGTKSKLGTVEEPRASQYQSTPQAKGMQTKLQVTVSKRKASPIIEELDLTQQEKKRKLTQPGHRPREYQELHHLHKAVQKRDPPANLHSVMNTKPAYCYSQGGEHSLSFMNQGNRIISETSSDYGDVQSEESLPKYGQPVMDCGATFHERNMVGTNESMNQLADPPTQNCGSETFGDDDSLLGAAMVGLDDSQGLRLIEETRDVVEQDLTDLSAFEFGTDLTGDDFANDSGIEVPGKNTAVHGHLHGGDSRLTKPRVPFLDAESSPAPAEDAVALGAKSPKAVETQEENGYTSECGAQYSTGGYGGADKKKSVPKPREISHRDFGTKESAKPHGFKDLEPWLFEEFGDVVELLDE